MDGQQTPVARTKDAELTLDDLAEIQPGMARFMLEVSERYWILYYAAKAGNWALARHELGELRKANRHASITRPKYREALMEFDNEYLKPIADAIRAEDWEAFEAAYHRGIDGANSYHRDLGYEYIEWQLPETPPQHLRLAVSRQEK